MRGGMDNMNKVSRIKEVKLAPRLSGNYKSYQYLLLGFCLAFLPRLIFVLQSMPISIDRDEYCILLQTAQRAGYNWSLDLAAYRYYGFGFTELLVPIMKYIENPITMYRVMVLLMALFQSLAAPISYVMMKEYFHIKDEKLLCVASVACSYMVAIRAVYVYPEFLYVLIMWCVAWLLLHMSREGVSPIKRSVNTLSLVALMCYAYSVHSRGVTIWIAVALGAIYFAIIYRRWIVCIPTFLVTGALGYIGVGSKISRVVTSLMAGQDTTVQNTDVSFSAIQNIKTVEYWPAWFNIIIGQINESLIVTGGIAILFIIIVVMILTSSLAGVFYRKGKVCRNGQAFMYGVPTEDEVVCDVDETYKAREEGYILLSVVFAAAVGITILGQSVDWLPGVYNAMMNGGSPDSLRGITYLRYYAAYVGPLMVVGFAYVHHHPQFLRKIVGVGAGLVVVLQELWVVCILPHVMYTNGCVWSYAPFSLTAGMTDEINVWSYLPGTVAVFVIMLAAYHMVKKDKILCLWIILTAVLFYGYAYNAVTHEGYRGQANYEYLQESIHYMQALEEAGALPEVVHIQARDVIGERYPGKTLYQINNPTITYEKGLPGESGGIYFTQDREEEELLLDMGYELVILSGHEFVYIK